MPPAPQFRQTSQRREIDLAVDTKLQDGVISSVLSQVPGITRQDAEDAVQEAWIVLARKADRLEPGPIGGYLMRTARFKALHMRDGHRRELSLDAITEDQGDAQGWLADNRAATLDAQVALQELEDDPTSAAVLVAAREGAAAQLAPRGINHQCGRYSDDQVDRVRALRKRGLTYTVIEQQTGVPAGYCCALVHRHARVTGSTEGWTKDRVSSALRRFQDRRGRSPRFRDAEGDPRMPSANTVKRLCGSWTEGVRAAGLAPAYADHRVLPWTDEEMIQSLCAWRLRTKRWPGRDDLERDSSLPSPATTRRRFGTQSPQRLADAVLARLA